MRPEKEAILEKMKAVAAEVDYTLQFYDNASRETYQGQDEMEIAKIKMKYAKNYILSKTFELKRVLKRLEGHLL